MQHAVIWKCLLWKGPVLEAETRRHYTNYFKGIRFKPYRTRMLQPTTRMIYATDEVWNSVILSLRNFSGSTTIIEKPTKRPNLPTKLPINTKSVREG